MRKSIKNENHRCLTHFTTYEIVCLSVRIQLESSVLESIRTNGYATIKLDSKSIIYKIRDIVDHHDNYLKHIHNSDYHMSLLNMQNEINSICPQEKFANELSKVVVDLCGSSNIGLSSTVYCRGVRPKEKTNVMVESIPMHREIFYTDLDYANHQINLHIPIKNYTNDTCMYYYPKSHLVSDSDLDLEKYSSSKSGVERYSAGHSLGLPYNPKIVNNLNILGKPQPCDIEVGEVFIFDSKLLHGGGINNSAAIRYSLDFAVLPYNYLSQQKQNHHASYKGGAHFYEYSLVTKAR